MPGRTGFISALSTPSLDMADETTTAEQPTEITLADLPQKLSEFVLKADAALEMLEPLLASHPSNMAVHLLRARALVGTRPDPTDARRHLVEPTEQGRAVVERAIPAARPLRTSISLMFTPSRMRPPCSSMSATSPFASEASPEASASVNHA